MLWRGTQFRCMPENTPQYPPDAVADNRIARLEERIARIEAQLGIEAPVAPVASVEASTPAAGELGPVQLPVRGEDEFELQVGQNWFAVAGIAALTIGVGFMLSLPYASLPAWAPSTGGFALAAGLFLLANLWRRSFEIVSAYLRGAGIALFFISTLRMYFFGTSHVLGVDTIVGEAVLVIVVALNLAFAWWRGSPWLMALGLVTGYVSTIAVGSAWFLLIGLTLLAAVTAAASRLRHWPGLWLVGIPFSYLTYFLWAIGNPFRGGEFHFVANPLAAPGFLLVTALILAAGPLLRPNREREDGITNISSLLNCGLGYGCFLVHSAAAFPTIFTLLHAAAFLGFLGLAILFWLREHSRVSTFLYAMTGYAALSMAIIKAATVPEVFVWLSLQSVVVVTTAIWFRSRFIVVANFIIYAAIVLGYIILVRRETGISVGFGIVALGSARILNWQKNRLELKTELMRNAYLLSAFLVFPYALYHLVSAKYVGLAWVGLAVIYYVLNLVVQNQKYRWMGHATLLLAMLFLVIVGISRFEPIYRVVSFLVLGAVLLIVSLSFTRWRSRRQPKPEEARGG